MAPMLKNGPQTWTKRAVRAAASVLDLVMPMRCVVCGREGRYLCDACLPALPRLEDPNCRICADPGSAPLCRWCAAARPAIDRIRAPYLMEGPVRRMVHDLKFRNLRASAPAQGRLLADFLASRPLDADVIAPVPLHRLRERSRGYNQSGLLATQVGRLTGLPLQHDLLARTRNTAPQVTMSGEQRRANMAEAFQCRGVLEGARVLLIDDVVTTGSTMSACAAALKTAGARSVWGLALARQA